MTEIEMIKNRMLKWRDFFGGDLFDTDAIKKATTKDELKAVLSRHSSHMEQMGSDAERHLIDFKKELGL